MPKTNIYPPRTRPDEATRRVEVGWRPDGDVQIATTALTDPATVVNGQAVEPAWHSTSYVDLDRAGINTLIRALREARDKAYGRDE